MKSVQANIDSLSTGDILDTNSKEYVKSFLYNTLEDWFTDFSNSLHESAGSLLGIQATDHTKQQTYKDLIAFVRDAIQEAYEEELDKRIG